MAVTVDMASETLPCVIIIPVKYTRAVNDRLRLPIVQNVETFTIQFNSMKGGLRPSVCLS